MLFGNSAMWPITQQGSERSVGGVVPRPALCPRTVCSDRNVPRRAVLPRASHTWLTSTGNVASETEELKAECYLTFIDVSLKLSSHVSLVVTVLDSVGSDQGRSQWGPGWQTWGIVVKGHLIDCVHLIQLHKMLMSISLCAQHRGRPYGFIPKQVRLSVQL